MTFAYPYLLWLLIIPAMLIGAYFWLTLKTSQQWKVLVANSLQNKLVSKRRAIFPIFAYLLLLASLVLGILALCRPQSGFQETTEISRGRDILLAIDLSRSMQVQDVQPSRLERARAAAYDLIDSLPNDRIGLIIFSGEATLYIPLTHDHIALRSAIEEIRYGWIGYGGTNLSNVLILAEQTFKKSSGSTNALVIISDGEDNQNFDPQLAKKAKEQGLIVVTAGVGTQHGDVIPDENSNDGRYHDENGKLVISKLNPAPLEKLAQLTNGQYLTLSSGQSLTRFVQEVIHRIDAKESGTTTRKIPIEVFDYFAIPASITLLLSILLGTQWKKSTSAAIILFCLSGFSFSQKANALDLPAWRIDSELDSALEAKNWQAARDRISELEQTQSNSETKARLALARGFTELNAQNLNTAREAFSSALLSEYPKIQAEGFYNLSQALFAEGMKSLGDFKSKQPSLDQIKQTIKFWEESLQKLSEAKQADPNLANLNSTQEAITENISRLKKLQQEQQKQEDQKQEQQDKEKQEQQDQQENNSQNKNDKEQKQDQKNDQQNKDKQQNNKQDKQEKQNNSQNEQSKPEQENKDDKQNGQKQNKPQQNDNSSESKEGQNPQQNDSTQENNDPAKPQQGQTGKPQPKPKDQGEKDADKKRAEKILRDYSDSEAGPILPEGVRSSDFPPSKDW